MGVPRSGSTKSPKKFSNLSTAISAARSAITRLNSAVSFSCATLTPFQGVEMHVTNRHGDSRAPEHLYLLPTGALIRVLDLAPHGRLKLQQARSPLATPGAYARHGSRLVRGK